MNLAQLIEQGGVNPFFLIAAALVLGAFHGLEPGHSKTMMAAFIIAVRGTVPQAILLGLSAVVSHSIIVWILGLLALTYGDAMIAEDLEPWFLTISGFIVMLLAVWMFVQRKQRQIPSHHSHNGPGQGSADSSQRLDNHTISHAQAIKKQFASGKATTGQVVWFGLTGGLIPCPGAITVLILCLHLDHFWLGVSLVGAFSVGLALTLVAVGVLVAWGVSIIQQRSSRFESFFASAPYVSVLLVGCIGILLIVSGLTHINH
jgi:nickel/cobalt exporter